VASSAATSMLAQWCLTAWKVAIGRPNWIRILAYSAACCVVSVAMPMASAANTALAVSVSSRRAPASSTAAARSSRTRAARRLWSRLAGTVTVTPPAARSTRAMSSPTGTSSTSARWPLITTPASPVTVSPANATSPPSATAPTTLPSARPDSSRSASPADAVPAGTAPACRAPARTELAITVGTYGPGASCRPICSATTSVSDKPNPEPP
jgi:hypothetical protein